MSENQPQNKTMLDGRQGDRLWNANNKEEFELLEVEKRDKYYSIEVSRKSCLYFLWMSIRKDRLKLTVCTPTLYKRPIPNIIE